MHMGMECWDATCLRTEEKSIEHYENYESMLKPRVLGTFSLAEVSDYLQTKILLLYCPITTGWVPNDAIHHLRAIFSCFVCTLSVCFIWLALDDTSWINAIFLSFQVPLFSLWIHSSFQYLFSPSFLLSLFFHEQEGFTLLLCHPNWLH